MGSTSWVLIINKLRQAERERETFDPQQTTCTTAYMTGEITKARR